VWCSGRTTPPAPQVTGPTTRQLLTRTARRGDTQRVALVRDALRLLVVLVTYPVSRRPVRPLPHEAMRSLPGDELVADAKIRWNHAITIRAHPADIWPWLVQMGCRRAGWYSYDGQDNGGVLSAERIDRLALGLMLKLFWHPLDFGMQRRQLLKLKRLVETA
jgi:hypothetical protein